eukprot:6472675-Alexandrium_andersonii.AAC.1
MSASLVGSEMCIRDRALGTLLKDLMEVKADFEQRLPQLDYVDNEGTVSYTHLTLPTICSV